MSRGVIIVGIPYPNSFAEEVKLKKEWNQKESVKRARAIATGKGNVMPLLNGNDWYNLQGFRALNQALGRCIRHRFDYGAIIFLDGRFSGRNIEANLEKLSKWVQKSVVAVQNPRDAAAKCRKFFQHMDEHPPKEKDWLRPPAGLL